MTFLHTILLTDEDDKNKEIPRQIQLNIDSLKHWHPNSAHTLYTNEIARDFILSHFDTEVLCAFDELVPLAYKADLLRYCILYELGGLYADASVYFHNALVEDTTCQTLYVFRDAHSIFPWITSNSVIFSSQGEEVFLQCIKKILMHAKTEYYGSNPLCITGPHLFGRELAIASHKNNLKCGEALRINKSIDTHSFAYVGTDGEVVAVNVKRGNGLSSLGFSSNSNYGNIYNKRGVYKSRLGSFYSYNFDEYYTLGFIKSLDLSCTEYGIGPAIIGPCIALEKGVWDAIFAIKPVMNSSRVFSGSILVCANHGAEIISYTKLPEFKMNDIGSFIKVQFELRDTADCVEIRLITEQRSFFVFERLEIEKRA